jgi:hypothetical protein
VKGLGIALERSTSLQGLKTIGIVIGCTAFAASFTKLWAAAFTPRLLDADIWTEVANTEDVGMGHPPGAPDPELIYLGDLTEELNWTRTWQEQLLIFLKITGLSPAVVSKLESKLRIRTSRRRAAITLLHYRDVVFTVRNDIFKKVSKEAVRAHTEINRLVVARHVEESFEKLGTADDVRAIIREACISACFIDTMYDASGQALALGPARRPV